MELGSSLPHSQQSTTCPYPNQINPFLCPSQFWQAQLVSFLVGLRTYQHPGKCVLYYCHRVSLQLLLTNIIYYITSYMSYIISYYISYHIIYHITSYHIYIISHHIIWIKSNAKCTRSAGQHAFFFFAKKLQYQILHIFNYHSVHEILRSHIKMCYCYLGHCLYGLICTFAGNSLKGYMCEEFVCRYDPIRRYRVVRHS